MWFCPVNFRQSLLRFERLAPTDRFLAAATGHGFTVWMLTGKELFVVVFNDNGKLARWAGLEILQTGSFQLFPLNEGKVTVCDLWYENLFHIALGKFGLAPAFVHTMYRLTD